MRTKRVAHFFRIKIENLEHHTGDIVGGLPLLGDLPDGVQPGLQQSGSERLLELKMKLVRRIRVEF